MIFIQENIFQMSNMQDINLENVMDLARQIRHDGKAFF